MAKTWNIDLTHSEVQFKVKHLVISTVTGNFNKFSGTIKAEDDSFENAETSFEAEIASIFTNNPDRDTHLKSPDFFDAEAHPKLTFKSTEFKKTGDDTFDVTGDITLRGTTKKVTLKAELGGIMVDPYGQTKAGFDINGTINRKDFGLNWSAVTEAGGVVVSDNVKLVLSVQFVKQ